MKRLLTLFIVFLLMYNLQSQSIISKVDSLIEAGAFKQANELIDKQIASRQSKKSITKTLMFKKEQMRRILLDFTKSEQDILNYVHKYIPEATVTQLREWEKERKLEVKIIDGERKYFSLAARNLFRLDAQAKKRFEQTAGPQRDKLAEFLQEELPKVIASGTAGKTPFVNSLIINLNYKVTIPGESLKGARALSAWLPFPRKGHKRQIAIVNKSAEGTVAPAAQAHSSLYFRKQIIPDSAVSLTMQAEYKAYAEYHGINFDTVAHFPVPANLKSFLRESAPHIVFTHRIKQLSKTIIGNETHKGKIVKLIFAWISNNIPWASAREYSTILNIPEYCAREGHGDCGIQSLLFITLCRYNGIPAKWQSGWMLHPGSVNLHDWSEIYVAGKGWVPVDQSFGLQPSADEKIRWFYLGNTDAYHLIINDDISKPFHPKKVFERSETVDFQRGEVETEKANLYFNEWDYHMDVFYSK